MSALPECQVRHKAVQYLKKHYRFRARRGKVYAQEEAHTHQRYGRKRADGLLAFRHLLWGTYVVSMEAKSIKTLAAIKPYSDFRRLIINSLKAGFTFCLLTGAIFALIKMDDGLLQFLMPLNALLFGAIGYAAFTFNSSRHQLMRVIRQLRQYPANEQWLAFSKDSVQALPARKRKKLISICRGHGIGLLLVGSRSKVEIRVRPKRQWKWGSYLRYYSRAPQIRKSLGIA